jgi:uncharacterized membrane protein
MNAMNPFSRAANPLLSGCAIATCVGTGIIGGVFFAFSSFVMKALAQLPTGQGVLAMHRINRVVINPLFLGVFVGSAVLAAGCIVAALVVGAWPQAAWLIAAGLLYLAGCFGVTMAGNVPLNNALARLEATSPKAAAYWPGYLTRWNRLNHLRTAASIASSACCAIFLAL